MGGSTAPLPWNAMVSNTKCMCRWAGAQLRYHETPWRPTQDACVDGREHSPATMKHHGAQHKMHVQMGGSTAPLP